MKVFTKLLFVVPIFTLGLSYQQGLCSDSTASDTPSLQALARLRNRQAEPTKTKAEILAFMDLAFPKMTRLNAQVGQRTQFQNRQLLATLSNFYAQAEDLQSEAKSLNEDDSSRLMEVYTTFKGIYQRYVDATVAPSEEPRVKTQRDLEIAKMHAYFQILNNSLSNTDYQDWLDELDTFREDVATRSNEIAFYEGLAEFYESFNEAKNAVDSAGVKIFPKITENLAELKAHGPVHQYGTWSTGLRSAQFTRPSKIADGWKGSPQDRPDIQELRNQARQDAAQLGMSHLADEKRKPGFIATKTAEEIFRRNIQREQEQEQRNLADLYRTERAAALARQKEREETELRMQRQDSASRSGSTAGISEEASTRRGSPSEDDQFGEFARQGTSASFEN